MRAAAADRGVGRETVGVTDAPGGAALRVLVLLERHLEDAVSERVPVQALDRHQRLLVARHRHEAEPLALLRREVADDAHVLDGAERPEQLPEDVLLRLRRQVVHEDAPAVERVAR